MIYQEVKDNVTKDITELVNLCYKISSNDEIADSIMNDFINICNIKKPKGKKVVNEENIKKITHSITNKLNDIEWYLTGDEFEVETSENEANKMEYPYYWLVWENKKKVIDAKYLNSILNKVTYYLDRDS